jgi:hypothetical protein
MKKVNGLVINFAIFFLVVGGVEAGWLDDATKSVNKSLRDLNQAIDGMNRSVDGVNRTKKKIKTLKGPQSSVNTPSAPNQNQSPQSNQNQFPNGNQNQSGGQVYPQSQGQDTSSLSRGGENFGSNQQRGGGLIAPAPGGMSTTPPAGGSTAQPPPIGTGASPSSGNMAALEQKYNLRTIDGRLVIQDKSAKRENILSDQENVALTNFFELIRLGTNPKAGKYVPPSGSDDDRQAKEDKRAAYDSDRRGVCLARLFLSEGQKNQVLEAGKTLGFRNKEIGWKGVGSNEFEVDRARKRFATEFLPQIVANAPRLPLEFVYVSRVYLKSYDIQNGGFPLSGIPHTRGTKSSVGRELELPRTQCLAAGATEYLPFAIELPMFWTLAPQTAEQQIISRIPRNSMGRKVFAATAFTLAAAPSARVNDEYDGYQSSLIPLTVTVKSLGLYEDPDLERLLHTFELEAPPFPAVLLTGVPEKVPTPKQVILNEETVTLLLLKERGDVLDPKAWETLANLHLRNDQAYYQRKKTRKIVGRHSTLKLNTFDPDYVPFFPYGFIINSRKSLTDEQIQTFKQWSLKRAAALPNRFVLRTQLRRDQKIGFTLDLDSFKANSRSALLGGLVERGYVPGQIVSSDLARLENNSKFNATLTTGQGKSREPIFVLVNLLKNYVPQFSEAQGQQLFGDNFNRRWWRAETELDVIVQRIEQIEINDKKEAFVIHVQPVAIRVMNKDASAALYEQAFQVAKLDPNQASVGSLTVSPSSQAAMPFTADVADLLMVKFVPEAFDQAALERMMLARWHYETSFNNGPEEPQGGRFFVEGKLKPNAQQRTELAPRFRDWTQKRAQAMSTMVTVIFPSGYTRTNKPGALKLGHHGKQGSSEEKNCRARAAGKRRNNPELAETLDSACAFLKDASTIPGRAIYIGGSSSILSPEKRSRRLQKSNVALSGAGVGPRMKCGGAIYGQDKYCSGMLKELQGDLIGQKFELDDVLVIDKEVVIPDNRLDITKKKGDVELDVEIVGIRRANRLPSYPFLTAYRQYEDFLQKAGIKAKGGRWADKLDQETVPLFLFDARVREARIVEKKKKSRQIIAKLPLQEPRSPDTSLLKTAVPGAEPVLSGREKRRKIRAERRATKVEDKKVKRSCQKKYKAVWAPREGTPEYEAAVATCLEVPKIEAYGPDMVGLRLGMDKKEASAIVVRKLKTNASATLKETRPFEGGTLRWTDDANRGIALFFINNHGRDLVAGISRRVYFGENGPSKSKITEGLRKKYGAETWSDENRALVWTFSTGSGKSSSNDYANLVDLLTSRDHWSRKWKPRLTREERFGATQKKQEKFTDYIKCLQDAEQGPKGDMAICNQKLGPQSSTQSAKKPKLPIMIKAEGTSGIYAKYQTSGPVVIVLFNKDANSRVKDVSFILFDPAWIARQPAFVFKNGGGTSRAKAEIDF